MRPYNPYTNYMPGYNPCMESPQYTYGFQAMNEGPSMQPPMCPPGMMPYTVQEGDTLYSIARMYGTTVADIMAANPSITDMNMIFTGQMLCVPAAMPMPLPTPMPMPNLGPMPNPNPMPYPNPMPNTMPYSMPPSQCPTGTMGYTVMQGDTLASIAERFSVSVYALTIANPGFSADTLMPGMRLCIAPFACAPTCMESERYTVAEGEDLEKIAEKYHVSADELLRANPFSPPCFFTAGNSVCLPAGAKANMPNSPNMQKHKK